jgi:site-specific DNA recombinase
MTTTPFSRPALYARVSSDQQAEAGTIASQVEALRQRVRQDQFVVDDELCFLDDGYSGTTLVRPALERLRDAAAAGGIDRLYVYSPDRLARKYAYQVLLLDELQRCGVEVIFLNRAIGESPEEHLLLQVQGMLAEYERAQLMERCRRGKLHSARQGCVNALAAAPYGYRFVRKADGGGVARFDVILEEARVVRQIFEWVGAERVSLAEVARRLQKEGIHTRTGQERWDRSTICDMLKNPAYVGTAVYGRTRVGPRRPRLRAPRGQPDQPRRPFSVYEAPTPGVVIPVPALISPELFVAAGEQLEENRRRNRRCARGARWLLQGLLQCQHCGYALYGMGTKHRLATGEVVVHSYYRCTGTNASRFGGQRLCPNRPVPLDSLDQAVWQDVRALLQEPSKVAAEYERRANADSGQTPSLIGEQVAKRVQQLRRAITRLIDAYQDGLLDKAEFEPRLRSAKERLSRLEAELQRHADAAAQQHELRLALRGLEEFAHDIASGLDEADWTTRRAIIRTLVKRIEVGLDGVRIVYRVSPPPFVRRPIGGALEYCGGLLETALIEVAGPRAVAMCVPALHARHRQPLAKVG